MMSEVEYRQANRALWDALVPIHIRSAFYGVDAFKAGRSTLRPLEQAELGDVSGMSLLHLQCHFGLDTLSWARLGAQVTGVDFSERAITAATELSQELRIGARFVCADVYDLASVLSGQFDIVYTTYGVLCWLPDLVRWAHVVARFLRQGGTFYMVEEHPVGNIFAERSHTDKPILVSSYFHSPEPERSEASRPYADPNAVLSPPRPSFQWNHSLSNVLNALIRAKLRIEFVHEFPFCMYAKLPGMELRSDGWWWLPGDAPRIPLLFSVKARND